MAFTKDDPRINRNGRPKTSEKDKLLAALERQKEKTGIDFWDKYVEAAYDGDRQVLISIAKKFIPDMSHTEIEGSMEVTEMPTVRLNGLPLELHIGEN